MDAYLVPAVAGIFVVGDSKQGKPPNLADPRFNEFAEAGDHALVTRLSDNSFEHTTLNMQGRAHPDVFDFVNDLSYGNQIKHMSHVHEGLDDVHLGLCDTLCHAYGQPLGTSEHKLRSFYIEIEGKRRTNPNTKSNVVLEESAYFFEFMYTPFYEQFGGRISELVKVYCTCKQSEAAWNIAKREKLASMNAIQDQNGEPRLRPEHFPSIMSVNATQGDECDIAILSTSIGSGHSTDQGHCGQIVRCTVLFSRARLSQCVIANSGRGSKEEKRGFSSG
jgi:hypothetical protein